MGDEQGKEQQGKEGQGNGQEGKTFTQADLDRIVQDRIARERSKFQDYDDLKKFRDEHQKEQDKIKQDELIRQKKYEEAEKTYKDQIANFQKLVSEKDARIQDITVSTALTNEIVKQNGMVEESVALLKANVVITADGALRMKSLDSNGLPVEIPLEEGVKKFLSTRPYLVKASSNSSGGGANGSSGSSNGTQTGEDLNSLNTKYWQALQSGNQKEAAELRKRIVPLMKGNRNAL